ncbi:DUF2249 domain-containing protein [Glycomyces sp. YM15]|uniref:DUF2249 domain-containing protein n=1 Tax=Glycomyces sp. YM15 TaxID=2800446 RepID=UPI001964F188|nr:DUF2249 domain-containing protein [Glycomyces sp. YM15]
MPARRAAAETDREVDVRPLSKPEKHPVIFDAFNEIPVGGSILLVNDHDPRHLRDEFEAKHPRGFDWQYVKRERREWRIRIAKLAATPLPRVLANTAQLAADVGEPGVAGAVWKLDQADRDLDSNLIALPPDGRIDAHSGPELDVLIHVLAGAGRLTTEVDEIALEPGVLLWLPRRSRREFTAGPEGLRYLTVHQKRRALPLETTLRRPGA